jgi:hypothetical protein
VRCTLETDTGTLDVIGASGAALDHDDPSIRAGFNLYEIEDDGSIASIEAHVLDSAGRSFERTAIAWRNTRS